MVRSGSPEEGEIVDLTVSEREDHRAGISDRNIDKVTNRSSLAARAPVNQRRRAQAPSSRPGRQRRRSRSRSWSRSRSRSPIAGNDTQKGGDLELDASEVINGSKKEQIECRESEKQDRQDKHVLTPTEKRIKQTAKEEAENQQNVEKISQQSTSWHNPVVDNLISAGKLCLVLDLDHTLLHSVMFSELEPSVDAWLQGRAEADAALPHQENRMLFRISGNVAYASAVIPFLDPTGSLFGGRIIAQGAERPEDMRIDQPKALEHGLEARESITIVVDDSFAVWQAHASSLIMVERYLYFPSNRLVVKGTSLLENQKDEDLKAGMLMITLNLLEKMHAEVFKALKDSSAASKTTKTTFEGAKSDVRHVLTNYRKKVLKGVHLVFSRVIPLEQDPKTHELWRMAEAFGASCSAVMQPGVTTHLVAGDAGTEKVLAARAQGIAVVSPLWLRGCCLLWKRLDEKKYAVGR
ncbi:putative RNA polymerase II C-terminal domain phosphatase-like 3 [Nannochloris sp. 'desiccata']|nr:putative RNA polymerase II C-terminal domain phosphatase-like 3 [Chlorella desiccata (nom. nud.)]